MILHHFMSVIILIFAILLGQLLDKLHESKNDQYGYDCDRAVKEANQIINEPKFFEQWKRNNL